MTSENGSFATLQCKGTCCCCCPKAVMGMAEYCFPSYSILFPIITLTCCVHVGHDVAVPQRRVRTLSRSVPGDSDFLRQFASCITCCLEVLSRKHLASGLFFFLISTLWGYKLLQVVSMGSLWPSFCRFSVSAAIISLPFPSNFHWAFFTTSGE